jgi:uncharacterized SAM-binding protein YcdF (DUF218 family)
MLGTWSEGQKVLSQQDDSRMEGKMSGQMRGKNLCRLLGFFGVAFFFISAFTPVPNVLNRWLSPPSQLERAEAIVVLGAGAWPDAVLSDSSMRRALHGILLYRKGLAPLLVFLGPGGDEGPAEAEIRAQLARELGISSAAILTEAGAWTTREEALRTGALLQARGVHRILLVTEAHHMQRARAVFDHAGFEVLVAPVQEISGDVSSPEGRLRLMRRMLQEFLARIYYRVTGYP